MKVATFNGSPKKNGNTYEAIKAVAAELEKENIEVEIVHVGNKVMRGCMDCGGCSRNMNERCVMQNDIQVEAWSPLMGGKLFDNEILKEIADNHNKSIAQIILRWDIQNELRKKIINVVKLSAKGEFQEAINCTNDYINQIKQERKNANSILKQLEFMKNEFNTNSTL
ncbi:flavodoxin [Clostridium botulinum]|uniref:Flavodoxin n=1 Tax=Clostridium botulinum TaxID=1491 RepID=A0AA43Y4D7_CLOBO|nr:flavodoxin [Clostridium botulinum]NFI20088.1 flavodoxin [Clostridium botulinum]NFQ77329.1 flavodoxin [Clostridium botulinum]